MPRFSVIDVIDSHTGGEPTRVVVAGGPPLAGPGAYPPPAASSTSWAGALTGSPNRS